MTDKTTKTYFPNLDGLRFLGSITILLFHVETIKVQHDLEPIKWIHYFNPLGNLAVSMFFVLSGFLLTYFLLKEKENTSTINLKQFYFNRILKIWPLYFLIGIIGFAILPGLDYYFYGDYSRCIAENVWPSVFAYYLFIPLNSHSETIGATWSVRVEEVFYLFWPLLLRRFKNYYNILLGVVITLIILRITSAYTARFTHAHIFIQLTRQLANYRFSCMAIGGLGAYLVLKDKQEILQFIYRKDVQLVVYSVTAILLFFKLHIPFIHYEFYSVLFACIIVNLATNPRSILKLDYKWMNYLGKISYGLYLYNPIMRILSLELVERVFRSDVQGWLMNTLLYIITIGSTILISGLSYKYFEKPFLRLKGKFRPASAAPELAGQ
jgi:peptidoglycan/LPS O-acetylase OafA/YrhL